MASKQPQMSGNDVREGFRMAADEMGHVQTDLKRIARESRIKVLDGDDRNEFLRNMTQDEFEIMHSLAVSMGPMGTNALERLMNEAMELHGSEK